MNSNSGDAPGSRDPPAPCKRRNTHSQSTLGNGAAEPLATRVPGAAPAGPRPPLRSLDLERTPHHVPSTSGHTIKSLQNLAIQDGNSNNRRESLVQTEKKGLANLSRILLTTGLRQSSSLTSLLTDKKNCVETEHRYRVFGSISDEYECVHTKCTDFLLSKD